VSGLRQEQFSILEKKAQLPITSFETSDEPASIVLLFDVSGSVQRGHNTLIAESVYRFVQASNEFNDYLVVAFNSRVKVLCGWGCRRNDLVNALTLVAQATPQTNTAFYDACDLAINQLRASKYRKQILLVVTDGQDNASKNTFKNLTKTVRESSIAIYAIGMIGAADVGSSLGMEGQEILDELTGISGGKAFYPRDRKTLSEVLESIALTLRHQYIVGFDLGQARHDSLWHSIKVKVAADKSANGKVPRIYVQSREGYYDR
jgi:Ca-activated chloride channel family protein